MFNPNTNILPARKNPEGYWENWRIMINLQGEMQSFDWKLERFHSPHRELLKKKPRPMAGKDSTLTLDGRINKA